jgi:hypothetical protein
MAFDLRVAQRLGDGGVVDFAVAVAAIADEVDDDVGVELVAVFGGEAAMRTTASGSSALTWKMGMGRRLARSVEKRVELVSSGSAVNPMRLLTTM